MAEIQLRPWQAEAIKKALKCYRDKIHKVFLIDAAPGAGKTLCSSVLAKNLIEDDSIERVIVIAPRKEVVDQWSEDFRIATGRTMTKVVGADADFSEYGLDICATWQSLGKLRDGIRKICKREKTLVICDEHHHAAAESIWGKGADDAFDLAKYILILSGTPVRSDGKEPIWFEYNPEGEINHPSDATYKLTYGEAVELNYCRPISFHRHEGKFHVKLEGSDPISVSGAEGVKIEGELKRIKGLQEALDYYKLACTPQYKTDGKTPNPQSYQTTMLEWGIDKLHNIRERMPNAGGLVIAPNIEVAEYMAKILEELDDEKPMLVHSNIANPEAKIKAFRNSTKRWIVSVAMVSEGVDIKRLRVLVFLPNAQTELFFRQAMGRVVRTIDVEDDTRAYVVMPTHKIFDVYARRVEDEMPPAYGAEPQENKEKICGICGARNPRDAKFCSECDEEFPARKQNTRLCPKCEQTNPVSVDTCQHCGESMNHEFEITLKEALREGAIVRGMDIEESDVREGERIAKDVRKHVYASGDAKLIKMIQQLPEESWGKLKNILDDDK